MPAKLIVFPSKDSLITSEELREISKKGTYDIPMSSARFNKFRYDGFTQRLNKIGFNTLDIDQQSGSTALWPSQNDGDEYWEAIIPFLEMLE